MNIKPSKAPLPRKLQFVMWGIAAGIILLGGLTVIVAANPDISLHEMNWRLYFGLSVLWGFAVGVNLWYNHTFPGLRTRCLGRG